MKIRRDLTLEPIIGTAPEKMLPERTALVLEGGGLRRFYSAGVFEAFMDAGIMFIVHFSPRTVSTYAMTRTKNGRGSAKATTV